VGQPIASRPRSQRIERDDVADDEDVTDEDDVTLRDALMDDDDVTDTLTDADALTLRVKELRAEALGVRVPPRHTPVALGRDE
jgi:hypothetical protein